MDDFGRPVLHLRPSEQGVFGERLDEFVKVSHIFYVDSRLG